LNVDLLNWLGLLKKNSLLFILIALVLGVLVWSAIKPHDYFTWFLEVLPIFIVAPILLLTYPKFRLTPLVYILLAIHAIILMIGGHYTYAQVPLFNWIRDTFDLSRNYYDRVGHFAQGFIPAIVIRELLLRKSPLEQGKWLFLIVTSICLAFSACYELFEWAVAVLTGTAADDFLGTQGDPWDTQMDMFFALCGAVISQVMLGKYHDRQISHSGVIR
jgi:putative membrane protein